jgi:hypothetical protein
MTQAGFRRSAIVAAAGTIGLAIALLLGLTGPSEAQYADCAASGYLGGVDDRMDAVALDCVEVERFSIETPAGSREVRIIRAADNRSPGLSAFTAAIRSGIETAAASLRTIGQGDTADITVWASALANPEETGAATLPLRSSDSECVMAMYEGAFDVAYTTAHEFFHCVQFATVGDATFLSPGTWWVEGSAEWFASFALPDRSQSDADVAYFDEISPETPLTSMGQESVVFFFWLAGNYGPSMVMQLITGMPDSGGEADQQDALAGMLPADAFQQFAQDYLDRRISQPGGRPIPSNPFPGDIYVWNESTEHSVHAERFVLARFQLEFACGIWSIERSDEKGTWKASRDESAWEDLPETISGSGSDAIRYRAAAFGTEADGFQTTIKASRSACSRCDAPPVADDVAACLVGHWQLVSGGYGEQIQRMLQAGGVFENIQYPDLEAVLIINADGTFEFPGPPEDYNAVIETERGQFMGVGTLAMASHGYWSVDGDQLQQCGPAPEANIDLTLIDPDGAASRVQDEGGPETVVQRARSFICSGNALTLIEDIPFTPRVEWHYERTE